jgi:hypothetical protein
VQAMVSLVLQVNAAHNMGGAEPQATTVVPAANQLLEHAPQDQLAAQVAEAPVCQPTAPVQAMVSLVLQVNAAHNMGGAEPQATTVVPAANLGSDSVRKE